MSEDSPFDEELAAAKERGWRDMLAIDEAYAAGEIGDDEWHAAALALVEPAYLSADTPQGQSGHSGDDVRWERARRLVLDPVERSGSFLDVGCANGLLMESVERWAEQDGLALQAFGVEISSALADLARRRHPEWVERVWTANAMTWQPPRRFTYVRTGLDYVPPGRGAAYVERLLTEVVEPGGRLILGTHNEEPDRPGHAGDLAAWGFEVAGTSRRPHPHPRLTYSVHWIDAPEAATTGS